MWGVRRLYVHEVNARCGYESLLHERYPDKIRPFYQQGATCTRSTKTKIIAYLYIFLSETAANSMNTGKIR